MHPAHDRDALGPVLCVVGHDKLANAPVDRCQVLLIFLLGKPKTFRLGLPQFYVFRDKQFLVCPDLRKQELHVSAGFACDAAGEMPKIVIAAARVRKDFQLMLLFISFSFFLISS